MIVNVNVRALASQDGCARGTRSSGQIFLLLKRLNIVILWLSVLYEAVLSAWNAKIDVRPSDVWVEYYCHKNWCRKNLYFVGVIDWRIACGSTKKQFRGFRDQSLGPLLTEQSLRRNPKANSGAFRFGMVGDNSGRGCVTLNNSSFVHSNTKRDLRTQSMSAFNFWRI